MATKSAEQKAIEKRVREEKRHALEAARRERAKAADMIKDFLVSTGIPNDKYSAHPCQEMMFMKKEEKWSIDTRKMPDEYLDR